jgi:lipopolysaccharide/colanic/teichoic acid biosynthesis glycosyltransferase
MVFQFQNKRKSFAANLILDFLLLAVSFLTVYAIKRGTISIDADFQNLIPFYLVAWLIPSIFSRKFRVRENATITQKIRPFIFSAFVTIGLLSIFLSLMKWDLSRFILWGSLSIFLVLEILFLSGSYFYPKFFGKSPQRYSKTASLLFFAFEFIALSSIFGGLYFYKKGTYFLREEYLILLVVIYLAWIYTALTTHKFELPKHKNYLKSITPFLYNNFVIAAIISFFIFAFRIYDFSRLVVFGSFLSFGILEILVVSLYFVYNRKDLTDHVEQSFFTAPELFEVNEPIEVTIEKRHSVEPKYGVEKGPEANNLFYEKLKLTYLKSLPRVLEFIESFLKLDIDILKAEVINSGNPYNFEILPDNSSQFILNLHEVNDFRRLNEYFIMVNNKLEYGGIFVGKFLPQERRFNYFLNKYSRSIAYIVFFFDFIWRRIFPKMPLLQKIYFAVTKGRNRVFSKAEALGRLYFCGFEIISLREIDNFIYFIVKKSKAPLKDASPSYGPLFKMRRVGKNGHPIYVYKFRTMHPYSEYLQSYVTELNGYGENGKIMNDFRATIWGKFLRRYWLDELPQLLNVLKGEMKLVGIRPVSERFLNEYPDDLKQLRLKQKPGCVPPYVALKKQKVEEYIETERTYLAEKAKHPWRTDIKYFFWAIYNIVTNKIRSA